MDKCLYFIFLSASAGAVAPGAKLLPGWRQGAALMVVLGTPPCTANRRPSAKAPGLALKRTTVPVTPTPEYSIPAYFLMQSFAYR